jgi:Zn-dependent oligopeptidase
LQNLAPWDTPYYTYKVKRDWLQVGNSEFSPYFSLGTCMEGLNNLMNNLYNISLVNDELAPGEAWASDVYKLAGIRTVGFFEEILFWFNVQYHFISQMYVQRMWVRNMHFCQ